MNDVSSNFILALVEDPMQKFAGINLFYLLTYFPNIDYSFAFGSRFWLACNNN